MSTCRGYEIGLRIRWKLTVDTKLDYEFGGGSPWGRKGITNSVEARRGYETGLRIWWKLAVDTKQDYEFDSIQDHSINRTNWIKRGVIIYF